jgi:hypothetical protein
VVAQDLHELAGKAARPVEIRTRRRAAPVVLAERLGELPGKTVEPLVRARRDAASPNVARSRLVARAGELRARPGTGSARGARLALVVGAGPAVTRAVRSTAPGRIGGTGGWWSASTAGSSAVRRP